MSRIYKQKKSRYYFYDTVIDGIRIRRSTHQTNKKLADEVRLKWDQDIVKYGISQFQRGITPESKLRGVCEDYLNRIEPICPSSDRFNQTKRTVNRFIEFCAANSILTPMDITKQIIEAFIRHLSVEDKLASKTVRNIIQIISQMFNDWVGMDIMQKNPCLYVKLPKQRQVRENRVLTAEDINIILNDSSIWRPYYLVLLETGLRAGDAACIFYEDFDLRNKLLSVRIRKIGKVYNLSVSDRLIEELNLAPGKSGPVFPKLYNTDPQKVNDRTAIPRKYLQKILRENNRPHATLHSFRHTFNHLLSLSGVSMSDRQILLAHSSTNTTKIYSHPDQNLQKTIINSLSQTIRELEKST
jgi:integrase